MQVFRRSYLVSQSRNPALKHMRDLIGEYFMTFSSHLTYEKKMDDSILGG